MTTYQSFHASVLLGRIRSRAYGIATLIADGHGDRATLALRLLRDDVDDLEAELSEILDPRNGDGAALKAAGE